MVLREIVTMVGFRVNNAQFNQAERAFGRMRAQSQGLASLGRNAAVFLTLPMLAIAKSAVQVIATNEKLETSFGAMMGSASMAKSYVKELYEYATKSPLFRVEDVGEQAKQLYAVGFALKDIIPTLQMLGQISSAVGVNINRLAYDYGSIKTMGYADWRHVKMLMMAKVPIIKPLTQVLGIKDDKDAGEKLRELSSKRKISFEAVEKAMKMLTAKGGLFGDIESAMQKSIWGKWQQFADTFTMMWLTLKDKVLPVASKAIDIMTRLTGSFTGLNTNTHRFLMILFGFVALIGPLGLMVSVAKSLIGPFGIVAVVMTALAIAVDDIYVWTQGGSSIMGRLFGDFTKYQPAIDALNKMTATTLQDLKGLLTDIRDIMQSIVTLFGGGSVGESMFKGLIDGTKRLVEYLDSLILKLRILKAMVAYPFQSEEERSAMRAKLSPRLAASDAQKNIGVATTAAMSSGGGPIQSALSYVVMQALNTFFDNRANGISMVGLVNRSPNPAFAGAPTNLTIAVDARNANGDPTKIAEKISQAFEEKWNIKMHSTGTAMPKVE